MAFMALDPDQAAVFFDDPIGDGQAETGPVVFCRKERGEDVGKIFLLDAGPAIGNVRPDKGSSSLSFLPDVKIGLYPGRDGEAPLFLHSFQSVLDQIEKHLGELGSIPSDRRQAGIEVFLQCDFTLLESLSL